jgi:hypothetical protein
MNRNEKFILIFLLLGIWVGALWYLQPQLLSSSKTSIPEKTPVIDTLIQEQKVINNIDDSIEPIPMFTGFVFEEAAYPPEPIGPVEILCGEFRCYGPQEFLDLYDTFEKEKTHLVFIDTYSYGIQSVDDYLKQKAIERGYQQRSFTDESLLVSFENVQTRPEIRDAYVSLRNEMLKQNIRLHLVSGHRSASDQRRIFIDKMDISEPATIISGIHDEAIEQILARSALPGFSKHHSGYAVDFGCGNDYLVYSFAETECYEWMSDNNFESIKKYGFIPSYPDGVENQGPNPEPWEYVWVGSDFLE